MGRHSPVFSIYYTDHHGKASRKKFKIQVLRWLENGIGDWVLQIQYFIRELFCWSYNLQSVLEIHPHPESNIESALVGPENRLQNYSSQMTRQYYLIVVSANTVYTTFYHKFSQLLYKHYVAFNSIKGTWYWRCSDPILLSFSLAAKIEGMLYSHTHPSFAMPLGPEGSQRGTTGSVAKPIKFLRIIVIKNYKLTLRCF